MGFETKTATQEAEKARPSESSRKRAWLWNMCTRIAWSIDVKTSNLFITRDAEGPPVVKLGDFGISRVLGATGDLAATAVGTPCYMAPELLDERPYDYKADVWSAGCVLFELLNLKRASRLGRCRLW